MYQEEELEYVGFWARVGAALIDTVLVGAITWPVLTWFYGESYWTGGELIKGPMDFFLSWVAPAVAVVLFWVSKQATPGKMVISARIVDSKTGEAPTPGQYIGRYLAYYVSIIPAFLGLIWVGIDHKKQGWHDKLAGTVVVRKKRSSQPVSFDG